jgi:probable rRNA maturation factor
LGVIFDYTGSGSSLRLPIKLKGIVREIARNENKKLGEICFIFVNRKRILDINRVFLKHDYETDVITFNRNFKNVISGDIYICIDVVMQNSVFLGISVKMEIQRVMIHGLLHLLGYNDSKDAEIEKIRKREDYYMDIIESGGFWND